MHNILFPVLISLAQASDGKIPADDLARKVD